jgi:pimeloyl-ACP methyl ester carboxylesterase
MSAIVLAGQIVHYEVLGRGRPVIFLHGWVGSWRYWIPSMQAVSIGFRAYAIDLWGFGDTARNPEHYSLNDQAALLDGFLQELGIARCALIGHGLGALAALTYASWANGAIDRVMTIGLPESPAGLNPRLSAAGPLELTDWLLGRDPAFEPARAEAPKIDRSAIQGSLENLPRMNVAELYCGGATSTLLVHGGNDPLVSGPLSPEASLNLPEHVHQVVLDESGHFPMLDEPAKFNRLMTDFLTLGSGVSPRQLQLKEEWKRRVR